MPTSLAKPPGSTLAACSGRALATVSVPIVVPSRESFTDPTSWVGTIAHRFFFRCQSTHRRRIGVVWIDSYQTFHSSDKPSKQWRSRWMKVRKKLHSNHLIFFASGAAT